MMGASQEGTMKSLLPIALAGMLCGTPAALAQTEVTVVGPGGVRSAVEKLIPGFEKKTGYKVKATFGSGIGTKQQVARGEAFDVPIVQPPYPEVLASGNVVVSSAKPLATVAVGVAVRKGTPKPDISTPDAVKRMLLAAKSVTYPDPAVGAAAGVSFEDTLKKLGILDQMQPKLKRARGGAAAMQAVAKGEAEIGLTFLSEMDEPGLDVAGPLPRAISTPTSLVGFVSAHAKDPKAAKALLDYLSSPEAAPVYRSSGMEPGK
jgi:molybdate transport system substrate-binding protein